jgi:hypothetical protein
MFPAVTLLVAAGGATVFFDVASRTLLQRSVDRALIARVFGLQEGLIMLMLAIGSALAPVLVALLGSRGALLALGVLVPLAALVSLPPIRRLDRRAVLVDDRVASLLRAIPIFEPLRMYELEDVARQLIPVTVGAGDVVIREGDPGDRFYVVVSGVIAVTIHGTEVARLTHGDYVGEIALLRDVPRTATVTAMSEVSLLALEREPFLAAMSGGRRLSAGAGSEIDRRLGELARLDEAEAASHDRNTTP